MLKKFTEGLVFGEGFAISFVAVWYFAAYFITPHSQKHTYHPKNLRQSKKLKKPMSLQKLLDRKNTKNYSFFKSSGGRAGNPTKCGVLFMAKLPTDPESKKPHTVQLWLTKKELWLIKNYRQWSRNQIITISE